MRPIDITRNFGAGMIFYGFDRLLHNNTAHEKVKEWASYKPEVNDSFYAYTQKEYKDISYRLNIGTKRNPIIIEPYYDLDIIKDCKIDVYFGVPKDLERGKVFYGDILIADFEI